MPTGAPLGLGGRWRTGALRLDPGDTILMFSDGVVERRDRTLTTGLEDLVAAAAASTSGDPRNLCSLATAAVAGQTDDDVAVLAVEQAVALSRSATMLVPAEPTGPSRVRQWMTTRLREWSVPEPVIGAAILCTSELTTNALLHAGTPAQVHIDLSAERLLVSVADTGTRGSVTRARTDALSSRGRGLGLIEELSDTWGTEPTVRGSTVWFEMLIPPAEPTRGGAMQVRCWILGHVSPTAGQAMLVQLPDLLFALFGVGALLAGILPRLLEPVRCPCRSSSSGSGMVVFALPLGLPDADPLAHPKLAEHLTEIGVIVALMGAGLKIDRPLGWRRWSSTWRLLADRDAADHRGDGAAGLVVARAGAGRRAAARRGPRADRPGAGRRRPGRRADRRGGSEDEVRFALTSEAGLNDGLAFPFVYAGDRDGHRRRRPAGWLGEWVADDVLYKVAVGVAGGLVVGWLLGELFFRARSHALRLARHAEGFPVLAATFLAYGLVEVAGGYGFLAVFVARPGDPRRPSAATSTTRCCTTSRSRSSGCSPCCCSLLLGGAVVGGLLAR